MNRLSHLVAIASAAAMMAVSMTAGHAADKASLRLNWILGGLHAPFYLGVERGYYGEEGIDLTIHEGKGSGVGMQIIAAKGDTFGMSDAGTLMLGAAKGQPVKAVISLLNISSFGVISLSEAHIRTAKDLEGKTLATSPGDALTQLFPAVIAANQLDADKIKLVMMDPGAKPVALMQKKVDALLGGIDDQLFIIRAQGHEADALAFADLGVNTVGMTVTVNEDTIAENPDLVARFVRATQRAWQAAVDDPQAAVDAALKVKPDANAGALLEQLKADIALLTSPNTKGKPIGYGAPEDWETTKDLLTRYRDLKTDRPADSFYTNEFIQ